MTVLTEKILFSKTSAKSLSEVRHLNLWACELTNVSLLKKCPNLEVLSLSVNNLTTLEQLSECKNLIGLPNLFDAEQVKHLTALRNLQVLWLCDNPCAENDREYRYVVIRYLPWIKKLDHHDVTDEEVLASMSSTPLDMPLRLRKRLTVEPKPIVSPTSKSLSIDSVSLVTVNGNSQESIATSTKSNTTRGLTTITNSKNSSSPPIKNNGINGANNGFAKSPLIGLSNNHNSSSVVNRPKSPAITRRTPSPAPAALVINGNGVSSSIKVNGTVTGTNNKTLSPVLSLMTPSRTPSPKILSPAPKRVSNLEATIMAASPESDTSTKSSNNRNNNKMENDNETRQSNVLTAVFALLDDLNAADLQKVQRKVQLLILNRHGK
ncbi:5096_t:CDS:2 [Ambispora leptoticha]|uniref:5096_t:CDS:1 n=1 Tax=Ambispora leptoticha TaxID=144679 RepID=A0A9N8W9Z2_9GLOM|nr:5096_t:CDS:2 [Ambispora leptoticha]